jgi:hypothetical protein
MDLQFHWRGETYAIPETTADEGEEFWELAEQMEDGNPFEQNRRINRMLSLLHWTPELRKHVSWRDRLECMWALATVQMTPPGEDSDTGNPKGDG